MKDHATRETGVRRRRRSIARRGSGLVIALSVLAMLAIMATTFITLMRLDVRITANYVDDLRCEMLARGVVNYFNALLRDDLDRTWGKYENRDAQVGMMGKYWNGFVTDRIPGLNTYRYGTYLCNDFWFNAPHMASSWEDEFGGIYTIDSQGDLNYAYMQESFASKVGSSTGVAAKHWDPVNNREYDAYSCLSMTDYDSAGRLVFKDHPLARGVGVDFDGDGNPWSNSSSSLTDYYYDPAPFVLFAGNTFLFSGDRLTGAVALPGGALWRWGVKLGVAQNCFLNLNTVGNVDGTDTAYLDNMGRLGTQTASQLHARRSCDEAESDWAKQNNSEQLGRISWKGFPGEYEYNQGGFPRFYNEVCWHPAQVSLERLFNRERYDGGTVGADALDLQIPRLKARRLVRYRWGADGIPGDGTDRWRVGWRRDGATYYRLPSPESPAGDDRYFGANEVMEHDHSVWNPQTSAVINELTQGGMDLGMNYQDAVRQAARDWRKLKPYLTMWSTDTILRGKIWLTEGWLPWRPTGTPGDWHHVDILKRVNLNMIGAKGPEGLPGEDTPLKTRWAAKQPREQNRLYFMLVAALRFTTTPNPQQNACQFIASLTDMVDRDQNETYYAAPDGLGVWALGVEKHPVINELVFYSGSAANTANYDLSALRVELYNPMENIPWIPDADEAYDVSNYMLRIASRNYRLGDLKRFTTNPNESYPATNGAVEKIGADGIYGYPQPAGVTSHPTWSRYMHLGWPTGGFPPGLTRGELEGPAFSGVEVSLWKPLSNEAASETGLANDIPGRVETINGTKYLCVDRTGNIKLVRPWNTTKGENGPGQIVNDTDYNPDHPNYDLTTGVWVGDTPINRNETVYLGIYRRWDPMNARLYDYSRTYTTTDGSFTWTESNPGKDDQGAVLWCPGWNLGNYPTPGRPNTGYPQYAYRRGPGSAAGSYQYLRMFERNFKVVDGDLPTIGWLGELMMWNCAQNGPLTWVHGAAQPPGQVSYKWVFANELDVKAKFDLFRPFYPVGKYNPLAGECRTENLQVLDIFTVWDPSNDGIDNDGDGAIDDDDTGLQPGDKCGPEVQVFGLVDLNQAPQLPVLIPMPDNKFIRDPGSGVQRFSSDIQSSRGTTRTAKACDWGPFETVGDMIRGDNIVYAPATYFSRGTTYEVGSGGNAKVSEIGLTPFNTWPTFSGDDDGDGIYDERDERDMVFGWVANYFTTRSSVFDIDVVVDYCAPSYYPNLWGTPRKLPFRTYKTRTVFARKQVLAILDRSTCLRVTSDGRCDFSGPVDVRMLRFSDEKKVY